MTPEDQNGKTSERGVLTRVWLTDLRSCPRPARPTLHAPPGGAAELSPRGTALPGAPYLFCRKPEHSTSLKSHSLRSQAVLQLQNTYVPSRHTHTRVGGFGMALVVAEPGFRDARLT